ncbi:PREDICTED: zinc finger MYM-type protein 1-like [Trachymyrmex cornetzi]|uniref:zinc finger MYM-type protein 1-like n=1 Tax=Trachymyrmex cornetzi TaxID=471704 RepID=UPI00084F4888|nr:PREDICTED: zinc finger MYM-type protein 1-like [Trachymyrmex cornetzi]
MDAFCIPIKPKTVENEDLLEEESTHQSSEKSAELEVMSILEPEQGNNTVLNSDRGLYPCEISDELKRTILSLEPSRPRGPFPKNSKVLSYINLASKTLQSPDITLEEACDLLESVSCNMMALRNDFSSLLQEAEVVAKSWQIDISFVQSRQRKVKIFYDELSEDFRFNEPSEKFRITVFNASLDVQISQLKTRFASMRKIKDNFSFLNPSTLIDSSEREIEKSARQLCDKYENDLSNCLIEEIASLKCTVSKVITSRNLKTISDLAQFLFIDYKILASNLPNVCTALILTLPVTSASAERSFSKLKLIKTYLRSTMSQSRLSGLATLSIEHELASKLDLDKVIKEFASAKKRRGLLAL